MGTVVKGQLTQSGADATTSELILTGIKADSKLGWEIVRLTAYWSNGHSVAVGDINLNVVLNTLDSLTTMDSADEIARINFAVSNTGGIAVAYPIDLIKNQVQPISRLTVQPSISLFVSSSGTAAANSIYYEVEYNLIKLSDLELLRLLQGGV